MLSCLAQLLLLACNGSLDEKVGDEAGVGQQGLGDRGGGVVLQPVLHGSSLVCVPVCSYHRLHHHRLHLHMLKIALLMRPAMLLLLATVTIGFDATCY